MLIKEKRLQSFNVDNNNFFMVVVAYARPTKRKLCKYNYTVNKEFCRLTVKVSAPTTLKQLLTSYQQPKLVDFF